MNKMPKNSKEIKEYGPERIARRNCTLMTTELPSNPYQSDCKPQGDMIDRSVCLVAQGRGFANCRGCLRRQSPEGRA